MKGREELTRFDVVGLIIVSFLIVFVPVAWFISGGYSMLLLNWGLLRYLRKHKHDRWLELCMFVGAACPGPNVILALRYVYNNEDTDDGVVCRYKTRIKKAIRIYLYLCGLFVLEFIIFVLGSRG